MGGLEDNNLGVQDRESDCQGANIFRGGDDVADLPRKVLGIPVNDITFEREAVRGRNRLALTGRAMATWR